MDYPLAGNAASILSPADVALATFFLAIQPSLRTNARLSRLATRTLPLPFPITRCWKLRLPGCAYATLMTCWTTMSIWR